MTTISTAPYLDRSLFIVRTCLTVLAISSYICIRMREIYFQGNWETILYCNNTYMSFNNSLNASLHLTPLCPIKIISP